MDAKLDCALDLLRRLPPQNIEKNLSNLVNLVPNICEELLSSVDRPLKVAVDNENKRYLLCDYNRDRDSYRSPWSNQYVPSLPIGPDGEGGLMPSSTLRELEIDMNKAFDQFRMLYYGDGLSSCYLWDTDKTENSFAGVVLLKKYEEKSDLVSDSLPILTKQSFLLQVQKEFSFANVDRQFHLITIGEMIEDKENQMRNELSEIYFGKTKDVLNCLRYIEPLQKLEECDRSVNDILNKLPIQPYPTPEHSSPQSNQK